VAKEKEAFTNDATYYPVGFEDAVAQASGVYHEMDFSKLGLGKTVVDGQFMEE